MKVELTITDCAIIRATIDNSDIDRDGIRSDGTVYTCKEWNVRIERTPKNGRIAVRRLTQPHLHRFFRLSDGTLTLDSQSYELVSFNRVKPSIMLRDRFGIAKRVNHSPNQIFHEDWFANTEAFSESCPSRLAVFLTDGEVRNYSINGVLMTEDCPEAEVTGSTMNEEAAEWLTAQPDSNLIGELTCKIQNATWAIVCKTSPDRGRETLLYTTAQNIFVFAKILENFLEANDLARFEDYLEACFNSVL